MAVTININVFWASCTNCHYFGGMLSSGTPANFDPGYSGILIQCNTVDGRIPFVIMNFS
jgi:hypothetical protein